jgi:glycosyltransferase involved in cell wall biosynthesis
MSRVHFVGRVPHKTLTQLMQVSAAHVYLTYPFVLSWSLLEAMSTGCLVVASDTAPVREVITHGRNGLLTDFFDAPALARAVADALERRAELAPLRAAARETIVQRYDLATRCLPAQLALLEEPIPARAQAV